jgi:isopenicillin-N epimerase
LNKNLNSYFLLDEKVVFLNHGSFGACPRPVFEAYQAWQLKLERQPVAFLDPNRGLSGWMRDARAALAGELGTTADSLVGVMNATYGSNIVAQSLALKEGDEILTTDHEYAALEKTWAYVARKTGAKIVTVIIPLPLDDEARFTDTLRAGITARTRVLFLSHITSATALRFPVENIVAEASARGIFSVIDGAHTPGHIPLNLDALGADFYVGNCHKWLMAPKGSAFLHVRPERQSLINPLVISHGWTDDNAQPAPFGGTPFIDSLEMQGTRDPSAWLAVPDAISFRAAHHWSEVALDCRRLVQDTAARVAAWFGLPAFASPEFCAPQMVAMPVPDYDPQVLQRTLMADYNIEIPCFKWKDHTIVRVSAQGYNTQAHMDLLVKALKALLP